MTCPHQTPERIAYVVTQGEYSDYSIVAVFSNKEAAQQYIEDRWPPGTHSVQIEEYPLDAPRKAWRHTSVHMRYDGSLVYDPYVIEGILDEPETAPWFSGHFNAKKEERIMQISVRGTDIQRAVKRANEIRTQWIALGRWGENP